MMSLLLWRRNTRPSIFIGDDFKIVIYFLLSIHLIPSRITKSDKTVSLTSLYSFMFGTRTSKVAVLTSYIGFI